MLDRQEPGNNGVLGPNQNADYWEKVFDTGKSPSNIQILAAPLDLQEMIASKAHRHPGPRAEALAAKGREIARPTT